MSDLVEVKVGGLLPDVNNQGSHILLLKIPQKSRYLPIWIGPAEASSIAMVLRGQAFERRGHRPRRYEANHRVVAASLIASLLSFG